MKGKHAWRYSQRATDELFGVRGMTGLMRKHAKQVQRVRIVRVCPQDLAIE
jgi:hypothetical protein